MYVFKFYQAAIRGWNNQLLVYDTITQQWSNPACKVHFLFAFVLS